MGVLVFLVVTLSLALRCSCQSSCQEKPYAEKAFGQCGTRDFNRQGPRPMGEAYEKEFPWSCLLLDSKDDKKVRGNCVVVPNNSENNKEDTHKILTVASKVWLFKQKPHDIIVRVGDYKRETPSHNHLDYKVSKIELHPDFDSADERLLNNIAIVFTEIPIDVNRHNAKPACFPSCSKQFNSASKCWVSGWNEDSPDGILSDIMVKANIPLVEDNICNRKLKKAFDEQVDKLGDLFNLDKSEICAGGEKGEDSCNGGGGSPLVCQGKSGRWSVVGLVSWGLGCRKPVPAIYTKITTFQKWIDECSRHKQMCNK